MKFLICLFLVWNLILNGLTQSKDDYRDSYCGIYNCKRINKALKEGKIVINDTSYCSLVIKRANLDSTLLIEVPEGVFEVKLRNKRVYGTKQRCYGVVRNDSVNLLYTPSLGPVAIRFLGKKIN